MKSLGAFQVLSWSNLTAEGLPPGVELILPQDLEGGSQACVELTGDDYPTLEGFYEVVITGEVLLNILVHLQHGDVSRLFGLKLSQTPTEFRLYIPNSLQLCRGRTTVVCASLRLH